MKTPVVITGMGAVTPLGNNLEKTWDGVVAGRSAIGTITIFDAATFPVRIAAEARDFSPPELDLPEELRQLVGRSTMMCLDAARMAIDDAGLDLQRTDRTRVGVSCGADEEYQQLDSVGTIFEGRYIHNAYTQGLDAYCELLVRSPALAKVWALRKRADIGTKMLALRHGIRGPAESSHTACSSSGHAIGKAKRLIEDGDCDVVLAGGHCSMLSEFSVAGFYLLGTLSTRNDDPPRSSRPFDLNRDGFIMGEGAGILVLESLEHARKRGARIHAVLAGYGSSSNAYRLTDTPPDGRGGDLSMTRALQDAAIEPERVDYINAHGTGTVLNDASETLSIKKVFGERAYRIPVSSSKSMIGHLVNASSAVELIITAMALQHNILPPTINYETPDPKCDLDYVPNTARSGEITVALSNSFAFGGQNATLVLEKFHG